MSDPKYKLSRTGFRKNLLQADWMVAEMRRRAERGKAFAENIAPDAEPYGEGYIASFKIRTRKRGGHNNNRAEALLVNTSPHAFYVEYGTHRQRGHYIMTGAMIVMGE